MKKEKNKMMDSTSEKVEKKATRSFTFPKEGITIKANSLDEAQAILAKRLKGEEE